MKTNDTKVQSHLAEHGIDFFLVSNLVNIEYLTGLHSSNALLLFTPTTIHLYTDPRYSLEIQERSDFEVEIGRDLIGMVVKQLQPTSSLCVDESFSFLQYQRLIDTLPQLKVHTKRQIIEEIRTVKRAYEIDAITTACEITSKVWEQVITEPFIGQSEIQIARRLQSLILDFGGDSLAFESIVAAGVNSASPHHTPSEYVIQQGDFIKCDFGAKFAGYHADMTRMAIAGKIADWQEEIFSVVTEAQAAATRVLSAGVSSLEVDQAARRVIQEAGFGAAFTHPTGHGIGLEIHEIPIHGSQDITLRPSMTLTVEPGIYLAGKGGVRLEDTLVVLEQGSQNLTTASKALAQVK